MEDFLLRKDDLRELFESLEDGACCSVVGLSNMGKSYLLRSAQAAAPRLLSSGDDRYVFAYIDCNLMVRMSAQGFYELTLRSLINALEKEEGTLLDVLEHARQDVIKAESDFQISLAFNEGLMALCRTLGRRLVLMWDEFDEPFAELDARVFLNLRALRDRFGERLIYVVATEHPLARLRRDPEAGEFIELFVHQTVRLGMLAEEEGRLLLEHVLAEEGVTGLDEEVEKWMLEWGGGHPGLIQAVAYTWAEVGPTRPRWTEHALRDRMAGADLVRSECTKLWRELTDEEQRGVIGFLLDEGIHRELADRLVQLGILVERDGNLEIFSPLFAAFARRQRLTREDFPRGVYVDVDAGTVWVDGRRVPTLTELEYRLLLLLYGRIGKICDKYQIVEAVWGEEYIDEVDDARIEKLVSRLRQKIEPDPRNPIYITTMRGRGYKLVER